MFSAIRDFLLAAYFRTPEHPGKHRLARWLGRHVVPSRGIKSKLRNGIRLYLQPTDWIEYWLLRGRDYEPMTLDFIAANLSPGDAAVFAGVNFGLHVIAAALAVGPNGRVIGFEPQPAAVLRTHQNLLLNGVGGRVKLVLAALGADERVVDMAWSQPDNAGAASLLDSGAGFSVCLAPLRKLLPAVCPTRPKILLLDVQGYELPALCGSTPDSLADILVVECDPEFLAKAGVTTRAVLDRMWQLGYSTHTLTGKVIGEEESELPERNVVGVRPDARPIWPGSRSRELDTQPSPTSLPHPS